MRRTFSQSLSMSGTSGATLVENATPRLSATDSLVVSTMPTMSLRSTSSRLRRSEPAWMRAVSSTLFTISRRMLPFFSTSSTCRNAAVSLGSMLCASNSVKARMDVSGVRNSWLTMARKSDLYWFSRLSRSLTSSTCARCRSSSALVARSCSVRSTTCDSRLPYKLLRRRDISSNCVKSASTSREA